MTYMEFLQEKIDLAPETGFSVSPEEINPRLKPHHRLTQRKEQNVYGEHHRDSDQLYRGRKR